MMRFLNKEIRYTTPCFKRCLYVLVPFSLTILVYLYSSGGIVQHVIWRPNQINQSNTNVNSIVRGMSKDLPNDVVHINGTSGPKVTNRKPRFFISGSYTGRLGNLMFEYASTLGISRSNNFTMLISEKHELHKYFDLSAMRTASGVPNNTIGHGDNGCCKFASRLMNIKTNKNITVHMYLQSFKYFQNISREIRREFRFHSDINATANRFIENVTYLVKNATIVGIHVRRGDLLWKDKIKFGYTVPNISYFTHAMNYFRNKYSNVIFIVCSDDIKWCEKNLNFTNVVISKGKKPVEDLAILSKCDHVIISTGTFGWWSAFLANGTTIYYNNWPQPKSSLAREIKHEDYFMPHWIPMGEHGASPPRTKTFYIGGAYTGRIGNLMFEYAARYGIGRANNLTVLIRKNSELLQYFKLSALQTKSGTPKNSVRMFESGCCKFSESLTNINPKRNISVNIYLQSYKYWGNFSNEIRREFRFNEEINRIATSFHANVTGTNNNLTTVGIHVRRGDIATNARLIKFGYTVPTMAYYENAMNFFRTKYTNVKFILCTNDFTWSHVNFKNYSDVIISKGNSPVIDLAILSKCKHTILSTGSFSWWAGFLSNGTTVYYENWPRPNSTLFQKVVKEDYFLPGWIPMT